METQQGVGNKGISTFLSFGAKNVQPQILEKMLVGRRQTVDLLEQYVREIAQNGVNHQVFMVGPRGAGKTHLLRVLYHRIADLVQTRATVVAYFAEEEYGISGYLDFLIRIINAFMRWYDADRTMLEARLEILRETPESRQEYVAESIISDYAGDKPLLIMSENFDTILEALGKQGQGQLRSWLYRHNCISIIATAQTASPNLGREDRPFYGFFSTIHLKKLSYEDSLALLTTLAETEKNETMLAHLAGKGRAQVRAIHELVKGNHRLLVTFYEFLKADTLADLSVIFMKTMNDLKPYYETFIRYLPAQQQKILHYLALAKIPQKGSDIAKNCFIATASLSKQLSELQRRHLIDALPDLSDKRNKLYDVSEPLLRIAIEIGEQREGITSLFIDFLALYYSYDEIKNQKERFENLYQNEIKPLKKQKLYWEVEARERALKLQNELGIEQEGVSAKVQEQIELGNSYLVQNDYSQAINAYKKATQLNSTNEVAWGLLSIAYIRKNDCIQAVDAIEKALQINPNVETAWSVMGLAYSNLGNNEQAIIAYQRSVHLNPSNKAAWNALGIAYGEQGAHPQALHAFQQALELDPAFEGLWTNLGNAYGKQGDYTKAIGAYQKAIQLNPNFKDAWYNVGLSYIEKGDYDQAIHAFCEVIRIDPSDEQAWRDLGGTYATVGQYDQAIDVTQKAVLLNSSDEVAWNILGFSYNHQNNYALAIDAYQKSVQLKPDSEEVWVSLAKVYENQNDYSQAIEAYLRATQLNPSSKAAWNSLGIAYANNDEYDQAVNAFQKIIQFNSDDEVVWNNLGAAYFDQGNYMSGTNAYQRAIEMDPTQSYIVENLDQIITNRLRSKTSTEDELIYLETWLQDRSEFEIVSTYVNTYRRVIFDKDEKALYELPKEQRIFFEREILKRIAE